MTLFISDQPVPLRTDEAGVIRVGDSRVSLDSVVYDYKNGATAEQIADDFPTLDLADIHAVIAWYLRHRQEVDQYLAEQQRQAAEVRKRIESVVASGDMRARLLARRAARNSNDASANGG
ncbi:MAG TPA: DUF433 domain-containing protein [Pirellulaceae bacterium]|nr:DUF433 domain-containing protein [Pirellulaceae bacterium]